MPKDGLIRLPDHITAQLMRALMYIRHTPQGRLLLERPESPRAPVWSGAQDADFDVSWRGRKVGRIWRFIYERERHEGYPWYWDITAPDRKHEWGHSLRLHEAMEQFRNAWDLLEPNQETA